MFMQISLRRIPIRCATCVWREWIMDQLVEILRAAGEPNRMRILALCASGDLSVSELTCILGQSQPGVSRHLRLLSQAGLLERYQEGSRAFFHVPRAGETADMVRFLVARVDRDDPVAARDRRHLEDIRRERVERAQAYFRENAGDWDRIRALHVDEAEVESALRDAAGPERIDSMLDIGTGTGRMLQVLAANARDAIGVDFSRDMLSMARTNLSNDRHRNCSVRQGDMYELPFADGSFDLAVLHMVLHFAERPGDVIGEAARVLRHGGRFLVADFAPHELESLRDEHAHRRLGFRDEEIGHWARDCGLTVTETHALPGEQLTVRIWKLEKTPSVRAATGNPAVRRIVS